MYIYQVAVLFCSCFNSRKVGVIVPAHPMSSALMVANSRWMLVVPWLKPYKFWARKSLSSKAFGLRLGSSVGASQPETEAYAYSVLVIGAQCLSDKTRWRTGVFCHYQLL